MFRRIKFLDLAVDFLDLDSIEDLNNIKEGTNIISLNAEQVALAQKDQEFKDIILSSGLIIPDGSSIIMGLNFLKNKYNKEEIQLIKKMKKLAGVELSERLIEIKNRVAILGSTEKTIAELKKKYGNKIVFAHHGFFAEEEKEKIVSKIVDAKPEILLVGMGAPQQEKFIYENKSRFSQIISMGVGGSLEVLSGLRSRAPKIFLKLHLEWFYRLLWEPFRLKRILVRMPAFLTLLFQFKVFKN